MSIVCQTIFSDISKDNLPILTQSIIMSGKGSIGFLGLLDHVDWNSGCNDIHKGSSGKHLKYSSLKPRGHQLIHLIFSNV